MPGNASSLPMQQEQEGERQVVEDVGDDGEDMVWQAVVRQDGCIVYAGRQLARQEEEYEIRADGHDEGGVGTQEVGESVETARCVCVDIADGYDIYGQ